MRPALRPQTLHIKETQLINLSLRHPIRCPPHRRALLREPCLAFFRAPENLKERGRRLLVINPVPLGHNELDYIVRRFGRILLAMLDAVFDADNI